ncbi:general secretion pathway protein G [Candidatus Magnetomorum sp. HK-1]|nr:general secretion pathway protein G [Candidatus Magnetomorum sp. HK-1]
MKNKAFTLIELLIVMSVIAILVAIIIPSYRGMQQEGYLTKAEKELNTLQAAIESYYRHNGQSYPENKGKENPNAYQEAMIKQKRFRIITQKLEDPFQKNRAPYNYSILNDDNNVEYYVLWSNGINGVQDWTWDSTEGKVTMDPSRDDIVRTNAIYGD